MSEAGPSTGQPDPSTVQPDPSTGSDPSGAHRAAVPPGAGAEPSAPLQPRQPVPAALAELSRLDVLPLAQHPELFQRVHGQLQAALAEIDTD